MRTAKEIIDQTNAIARIIYATRGYHVDEGFEFHTDTINRHPHKEQCWAGACQIQELMTNTYIPDVIEELEEENEQ